MRSSVSKSKRCNRAGERWQRRPRLGPARVRVQIALGDLADACLLSTADTVLEDNEITTPANKAANVTIDRDYLARGVFYAKNPNSIERLTAPVRAHVNTPSSVDAVFANGGLTSSGGHPVQVYGFRGLVGGTVPVVGIVECRHPVF